MTDKRHKNKDWALPTNESGQIETWQAVEIAVLMDIRDGLQQLNSTLRCPNFLAIPRTLYAIRRNTAKKRKARSPNPQS